jgi:hypothetical protein
VIRIVQSHLNGAAIMDTGSTLTLYAAAFLSRLLHTSLRKEIVGH